MSIQSDKKRVEEIKIKSSSLEDITFLFKDKSGIVEIVP